MLSFLFARGESEWEDHCLGFIRFDLVWTVRLNLNIALTQIWVPSFMYYLESKGKAMSSARSRINASIVASSTSCDACLWRMLLLLSNRC